MPITLQHQAADLQFLTKPPVTDAAIRYGCEWIVGDACISTWASDLRRGTDLLRNLGGTVEGVVSPGEWCRIWSPELQQRRAAAELLRSLVHLLGTLGIPRLRLVPQMNPPTPVPRANDLEHHLLEGLIELLGDAEQQGVRLCIHAGSCGVLTSPEHTRELLDRLNSWTVGAGMCLRTVQQFGRAEDWFYSLRYRLSHVVVPGPISAARSLLDDHDSALQRFRFDGPLIIEATGQVQ